MTLTLTFILSSSLNHVVGPFLGQNVFISWFQIKGPGGGGRKKTSENDQLTCHLKSFFNIPRKKESKTSKVNRQPVSYT